MIQAVNNFVFVIRDKVETERSGILIPGTSRVKPHKGVMASIGDLVQDKKIKGSKNKSVLFHQGVGFEIEYEGTIYLVLEDRHIIAVV